jgi:hypothetical protein
VGAAAAADVFAVGVVEGFVPLPPHAAQTSAPAISPEPISRSLACEWSDMGSPYS